MNSDQSNIASFILTGLSKAGWTVESESRAVYDGMIFTIYDCDIDKPSRISLAVPVRSWTLSYFGHPLAANKLASNFIYTGSDGKKHVDKTSMNNILSVTKFFADLPPYARLVNKMLPEDREKSTKITRIVPGSGRYVYKGNNCMLVQATNSNGIYKAGTVYLLIPVNTNVGKEFDVHEISEDCKVSGSIGDLPFSQYKSVDEKVQFQTMEVVKDTGTKKIVTFSMNKLQKVLLPKEIEDLVPSLTIKMYLAELALENRNYSNMLAKNVTIENAESFYNFCRKFEFDRDLYEYEKEISSMEMTSIIEFKEMGYPTKFLLQMLPDIKSGIQKRLNFFTDKQSILIDQGANRNALNAFMPLFGRVDNSAYFKATSPHSVQLYDWIEKGTCVELCRNLAESGVDNTVGFELSMSSVTDAAKLQLREQFSLVDLEVNGLKWNDRVAAIVEIADWIGYSIDCGFYIKFSCYTLCKDDNSIFIKDMNGAIVWRVFRVNNKFVTTVGNFASLNIKL